MEDRPFAAKHKEKVKAWCRCAKNVRAAAERDPDPLIQNRGRYVTRENLQNRMKTFKKKRQRRGVHGATAADGHAGGGVGRG